MQFFPAVFPPKCICSYQCDNWYAFNRKLACQRAQIYSSNYMLMRLLVLFADVSSLKTCSGKKRGSPLWPIPPRSPSEAQRRHSDLQRPRGKGRELPGDNSGGQSPTLPWIACRFGPARRLRRLHADPRVHAMSSGARLKPCGAP